METQDRRVKRTQNLLSKALIDLTLEKGYETVTIRDITDRADIGYATFFRHYPDKDALLQVVLVAVLGELTELIMPPQSIADYEKVGTLLFRYVDEHEKIIRVLLSSHGSTNILSHAIKHGTQKVLADNKPLTASPIPPDVAAYHLVASSISLIQWWLDQNKPHLPEKMGIIYKELIAQPTLAIAFE